jgi:hypothetical protein
MIDPMHTEGTTVMVDGDADGQSGGFQAATGTATACEGINDEFGGPKSPTGDVRIHGNSFGKRARTSRALERSLHGSYAQERLNVR